MRRTTAGTALIAAVGFSALTITPATAAVLPFPNCDAATAAGVHNIPADSPAYAPDLDSDSDGIGCESTTIAYDAERVAEIVATDHRLETLPPGVGIIAGPEGTDVPAGTGQITQVPVGGADTGVAVEAAGGNGTAAAAAAGALGMAVVAGGAVLARRRARTA
jgi:hypothetical protein